MRNNTILKVVPAILVALTAVAQAAPAKKPIYRPEVIYGEDHRADLYQVTDNSLIRLADSTVGFVKNSNMETLPSGQIRLKTKSYAKEYQLCTDEPFYDQKTAAFCSGSLVGPALILTAGHCIDDLYDCQHSSVVFGFAMKGPGQLQDVLDAREVYKCKEIVGRVLQGGAEDWAVIRLDRKVEGHTPLEINREQGSTEPLTVGTELVMIGHPAGLPEKIAGGASVRSLKTGFFIANTDSYGGNSGSPVFNARTHKIEGILVRGETDYIAQNIEGLLTQTSSTITSEDDEDFEPAARCYRSYRCTDTGCRGEDVTFVQKAMGAIPAI